MKNSFFLFVLLCSFLSSCSPVSRSMKLAEEIVMDYPDSAFALLRDIPIESAHTPWAKARLSLLKTIAENRTGVWISDDSLVLKAYHYYQWFGKKENRMKTLYYKGLVEHNKGDYINACQSLLQAEQLSQEVHDNHYLGLIYRHLSEIYTENYDYVRALKYGEKALAAFNEKKEKIYADYMAAFIAGLYIGQHNWGKARQWADSLLRDISINNSVYCQATRYKAETYIWQADYKTADTCYQRLLERNTPLLNRDLFGLAMVKEYSGDSENADMLLKQIEALVETPEDSAYYYDNKHNVYDLRGDIPAAYDALVEALKVQNRVVRQQLEQSVSYSMASAYQSQYELERTRHRLTRIVWMCSGLVLLLFILGLMLLLRRKNRTLLEEMAVVEEVERDLERQRVREKEISTVLDSFISEKIRSLHNIAETYFNWEDESIRKREEKQGKMTPNEMLTAFHRQVGEIRKDKRFIRTLESHLNLSHDGLMDRLRKDFPKWDEEDFTILTLFFSGFSAKSIGFFLRMSDPAVRMRKTRFKQAFEKLPDGRGADYLERL